MFLYDIISFRFISQLFSKMKHASKAVTNNEHLMFSNISVHSIHLDSLFKVILVYLFTSLAEEKMVCRGKMHNAQVYSHGKKFKTTLEKIFFFFSECSDCIRNETDCTRSRRSLFS